MERSYGSQDEEEKMGVVFKTTKVGFPLVAVSVVCCFVMMLTLLLFPLLADFHWRKPRQESSSREENS
jgi:hypothetical protein